jgi:hypothetical protein
VKWLAEIRGEHDRRESFSDLFNNKTSAITVPAIAVRKGALEFLDESTVDIDLITAGIDEGYALVIRPVLLVFGGVVAEADAYAGGAAVVGCSSSIAIQKAYG